MTKSSKIRKERFTDHGGQGTEIRGPDGKLLTPEVKSKGKKPGKKGNTLSEKELRSSLIRLAHSKPELRPSLLPLLKKA